MNFSEIKPQIYTYLGFHGVDENSFPDTDKLIKECLKELETIAQFRYMYKTFDAQPEFLQKEPYLSFLSGCTSVILAVMTLGAEVDRRIKILSRNDMTKSVVTDACASALLEHKSDEYEKSLGDNLTYRFCPGYGGSDISDIRNIFRLLNPEKIGVTLLDTDFMLPSKSMAGILGVGKSTKKSCGNCILSGHCEYLKEGIKCYGSERK